MHRGDWRETGYYDETISTYASWQGCVEARPYPYNVNDTPAQGGTANTGIGFGDPPPCSCRCSRPTSPATAGISKAIPNPSTSYGASNNWWNDGTEDQFRQHPPAQHEEVFRRPPIRRELVARQRPELQLHDDADHAAYRRHHRGRACRRSRPPSIRWPPTATPTFPKAPPGAGARSPARRPSPMAARKPKRATTRSSSC